jgi:O-antigen/teichoic acid export membrane protein
MFIDKAFLLVGGFVVSVMVARYLGPSSLGLISYGIALGAISIALTQWGANYTIYNTAAVNEIRSILYVRSTEKFRILIYCFIYTCINIGLILFGGYEFDDYLIVSLVLLSQIFLAIEVYQFYYNARLKSKINATSSIISKLISMTLRLIFVIYDFSIYFFIIPFFIEGIIIYLLRKMAFSDLYIVKILKDRDKKYRDSYIRLGIPLVITGICTVSYTKINEILLGNLVSYDAVGIYSVAFALNSAWTFIPMSIGISLLSKPISEKNEYNQIKGFSFITLITLTSSFPMVFVCYFFSSQIIQYTYGSNYIQASDCLFLLSLSCCFSVLGFLTNRMISLKSGGGYYLLKKNIISLLVVSFFSYYFINKYGYIGAAYSCVFSEFINLTIFNYFFKNLNVLKLHVGMFKSFYYYKSYVN